MPHSFVVSLHFEEVKMNLPIYFIIMTFVILQSARGRENSTYDYQIQTQLVDDLLESYDPSVLPGRKASVRYGVSHKSVYAFSNSNISTMLNTIIFNFLCIVDLTFIVIHKKFQSNRQSHF